MASKKPTQIQKKAPSKFPIVGIGASAGGLAAFESFFSAIPTETNSGMAFVLIQHLAPDHESLLSNIIQNYTRMEVFEVENGMPAQPNCVYIIPPNRDMAILNNTFQLLEPSLPHGHRLPIDFFFHSLAQDQHKRAIAIILSGTGSDGSKGIASIKAQGGIVMAEDLDSCEFDGMPKSAINTGLVDYVLPPGQMLEQLISSIEHPAKRSAKNLSVSESKENDLHKIFILLHDQTGHDFSQYKPSTVNRRIQRRMAVQHIDSLQKYAKYLQHTPAEIDALFGDLLIGVSNFFRDPEAFAILKADIIPKILSQKPSGSSIRVWSTGCSTGEEAYSIAILFKECMEETKQNFTVQIFATDIDPKAIAIARAGTYPSSISDHVSKERLAHFFTPLSDENGYKIHKSIRDMLIFSQQNVIKDPPFSKLDLLSCRNLLIYMDVQLQKRVIPLFHYALNPQGILFLGSSESVGEYSDLFATLDQPSKIYQRKETNHSLHYTTALPKRFPPSANISTALPKVAKKKTKEALLQQSTQTESLLTAQGETLIDNILKKAREELRRELATQLHKAAMGKEIVHAANTPLHESDSDIEDLQHELFNQKEFLNTANAKLEISNEELKSFNEEMQSLNEELQSTNEELETSKEELQSVNEELSTVNTELQTKVSDLSRSNNDMNNLLAGTGIGTIFVDHNMCILRFTPAVTQIIHLILSDLGRPVGHILSNIHGYDRLVADTQAVLDTLVPKEIEVQTAEKLWYTLRIQPYRTLENVIEGAVISFVNITETVQMREALQKANELSRLAVVLRDAHDAITVQDMDGHILAWNNGAVRMYGWSEAEALSMNVSDRIPQKQRKKELSKLHELSQDEILKPYRTQRLTKKGDTIEVWMTATSLIDEHGKMYAIATTERAKSPAILSNI